MDLRLLKSFVGVTEHGTVSKAAEVMRITQPALSRQIRSLEQQIGLKLFKRAGRGLSLTPYGEQFLHECRALLSHSNSFDERMRQLRRGDLHVLRIAAPALTIEALLPPFLPRFTERFPDVRVQLMDTDAADHLAMLEHGEADLSINVTNLLAFDDRHFGIRALPRFQMLAAWARSFAFKLGPSTDIASLVDQPMLLLDRTYATRNVFDAACDLANFKPKIFFEGRSASTILALAEAGQGIAIIPSALHVDEDKIQTTLITHRREPLQINLAVIWDTRRAPVHYVEQFAELLWIYILETYPVHSCLAAFKTATNRRPQDRERRGAKRPQSLQRTRGRN